jgi:cytochrome c peroxidase
MRHFSAAILAAACLQLSGGPLPAADNFKLTMPAGLADMKIPADNPLSAEKIELGKQLYFDKRLSRDDTISCASCHAPDKGWSNGERFATGVRGQKGGRSAPSVMNTGYYSLQFWDGRANELEGQALGPIQNPIEMDMTLDEVVAKLNKIAGYRSQFRSVFNTDVTSDGIAKAIASFERTVLSGAAPYDRYVAGDKKALSEGAARGMQVFFNKGHCSACHQGPNFSDGGFHNIGIGMDDAKPDEGRYAISKLLGDRGAFKTPSLRDIARTAPYMHDGRLKTLEEVVDHYAKGGTANDQLDEEIYEIKLTAQDKADLVTFMKEGLASDKYPDIKPPKLPE